jgi:hypothetical protein
MPYGFDHDTHAPIVVLRWRGEIDPDDFARCLEQLTALFGSWNEPGYIVFDFADIGVFDSRRRQQLASWRAKNRQLIYDKVAAGGYVFTSKLARGYLTAVDWLRPLKGVKRGFFGSLDEAVSWVQSQRDAQLAR